MKLFIKVKPKAREEKVEKIDEDHLVVHTKEIPEKGKANEGVIRLLSVHFSVSKSQITIVSGKNARTKIVIIEI
jgi:hypothetical protein